MRLPDGWNWREPDYGRIFEMRMAALRRIRAEPECLPELKAWYRERPDDFINDWGMTFDPRLVKRGLPALVPFLLFDRQREFVRWTLERWRNDEPGLGEKSRDMGLSWLLISLACTLCLHYPGMAIGFGSRKEEYVDKIGSPKSMFQKGRIFMANLPIEFRGGWQANRDAPYMRMMFPETGAVLTGEAGDQIGRGDRAGIYIVDEAAHLERPESVDAALSQTTNCRIDISSVNGMNNPFATKRHGGAIDVFVFDWHAQPLDAKLLTPDGWLRMGDVSVGDRVIGSDGKPVKVVGVYPQGEKEIYRVRFSDGASTECCGDHLWSVIPSGNQRLERRHIRRVMPLREMMDSYVGVDDRGYRRHHFQIPLTAPCEFSTVDLPLDPYVLGCLLGDGSLPTRPSAAVLLTSADKEIISLMNARLPRGCDVKQSSEIQYRISANRAYHGGPKGRGSHNPVNDAIRNLGLSGTKSHSKFIPQIYLFSSVTERLDLLCGLMDTDGHASQTNPGTAIYATISKDLAEGVVFLAQTLGGTAALRKRKVDPKAVFPGGRVCQRAENSFAVEVRLPGGMIPFKLRRKIDAYRPATKYAARRSIIGIDLVGGKKCQCIKVDSDDGLYLTDDCIVTHNSDPRKDAEWYAKQKTILDPVVLAQEVDRDYTASVEGIVIPNAWIQAAIDAHQKLGIAPTGSHDTALDIADEGSDRNAFGAKIGVEVVRLEEWSGKGSDIFHTIESAFLYADEHSARKLRYDADGLGAGARGDARVINERRRDQGNHAIGMEAFRGSAGVFEPEREDFIGRTNQDFFANAKAQAWWALRARFQRTFRWVTEGIRCPPDDIISINTKRLGPIWQKLVTELGQPTYSVNGAGKVLIDKMPDGQKSPNLGDVVMMLFAQVAADGLNVTPEVLATVLAAGRGGRRRG